MATPVLRLCLSNSSIRYVFPVRLGTPSQTLYLLFDTGSGDFWVWSWLMPTSLTAGHTIYTATDSSTSERFSGQSFNLQYLSGTAYGTVWTDSLYVDGTEGTIGVTGNPIECADNIGGAFASLPAVDGVMGLNTWINDSEFPNPQQTWLGYILSNLPGKPADFLMCGVLISPAPVFTVALVQNGVGTIDFGLIDSSKYTGRIAYTPVVAVPTAPDTGYWAFTWTGFAIGSRPFNATVYNVLTDTGANLVLLPNSITMNFYSHVEGAYKQSDGSWCFPCSATLPSFTFGVGGSLAVVAAKHLIFSGLADGINCYGAIQATGESSYAYFGTPFLNALFVVHDYGGHRLGFAARTSS